MECFLTIAAFATGFLIVTLSVQGPGWPQVSVSLFFSLELVIFQKKSLLLSYLESEA